MKFFTLLPSNQSFYRQITSHEKGGGVSGVGQWRGTATEYKIVVTGLIDHASRAPQLSLLQLLHVSLMQQ